MSSGLKCNNCGSNDVEDDSDIGQMICTHCGTVLANNLDCAVEFIGARPNGQFLWTNTPGLADDMLNRISEKTFRIGRQAIIHLGNQLNLNSRCIDMAINFFKMAATNNLTRRRERTHIYASCVYMSCRIEGTNHMLNDISDVLQISSSELGNSYLELRKLLSINVPLTDPCIFVMRFANKMEFGDKTHQVTMTAQRIVQRMKKDYIHTGRKLAGYCGAALIIAARVHGFNREMTDIVRIVNIQDSTLRKRLAEFGDTPSSKLTLDEFMNVDLESEEDPPAFKRSCKRDIQRRLKYSSEHCETFSELQMRINSILDMEMNNNNKKKDTAKQSPEKIVTTLNNANSENGELDVEGLDDDEINLYISSEKEVKCKEILWNAMYGDHAKEKPAKKLRKQNISSKINYDVLKEANANTTSESSFTIDEKLSTSSSSDYCIK